VEMYLQIIFSVLAVAYVVAIVFVTRSAYRLMKKRGFDESVAVYYNRKIVHMATGGFIALLVPFIFESWIYPFATSLALTLITTLPRLRGQTMGFMQTKENWNDSKFSLMWGLSIAILWILFNDPFLAIIPALFMAFGDAVTGLVRNALYKKRTKKTNRQRLHAYSMSCNRLPLCKHSCQPNSLMGSNCCNNRVYS
jgi:phytol kinase